MAIVNKVDKKVRTGKDQVIKYQILTYCFLNDIQISLSDLNCLLYLAKFESIELTEFCKLISETGIFKSSQSCRNAITKAENQINEDINLQLSAVPNPAENSLFIRCRYDQNIQNSIKLRIYNIIGDEVYSEVISSNKTIEIDVSKFHKGTYIINAVEVNSVNQNGNINRASKIIIVK